MLTVFSLLPCPLLQSQAKMRREFSSAVAPWPLDSLRAIRRRWLFPLIMCYSSLLVILSPPSLFKSIEPQHQIYIAQLNKNLNVDWSPGASGFNFPAYMNSACGGEKLNCRTQLFYHQGEMFMAIITTRIISFGEELTWNYGKHRVFECPCGYEDCKSKTKSRRR